MAGKHNSNYKLSATEDLRYSCSLFFHNLKGLFRMQKIK